MGDIIASHNTRILRQVNQGVRDNRQCNCRVKADCPLGGQCLASSLVYKGEISTDDPDETRFYIGACSSDFKLRLANHKKSFRHERYSRETTLSSYFWKLKEKGKDPTVKWSIVKRAAAYHPSMKRCYLCLAEKTVILESSGDKKCLNTRSEMFSRCRHRNKWTLAAVT